MFRRFAPYITFDLLSYKQHLIMGNDGITYNLIRLVVLNYELNWRIRVASDEQMPML